MLAERTLLDARGIANVEMDVNSQLNPLMPLDIAGEVFTGRAHPRQDPKILRMGRLNDVSGSGEWDDQSGR